MEINPFDDVIVSEPRRIETPVMGLNQRPLEQLHAYFKILLKGDIPRAQKLDRAQFVLSPEAGYGKSHLIGRLFKSLQGRSTLVYLRPFGDPGTCWKSNLLKTLQEMEFPESGATDVCIAGEINQLEAFCHGVLVNILISGIKSEKIKVKNKESSLKALSNSTLPQLRSYPKRIHQLMELRSKLAGLMKQQLGLLHLSLSASPSSWLNVLISYAFFPNDFERREGCLDWLKGGSINSTCADAIGLRPSERLGPDASTAEVNEVCKQRIFDLCRLAGFYRPFVFCFDQTESYGLDPLMAQTLGLIINELVDNAHNAMTVMTANQLPWNEKLKKNWEEAQIQRLSMPFLELEGISKDQGEELIRNRLYGFPLKKEEIAFLSDPNWVRSLFHSSSLGVRQLLNECKKRWHELREIPPPDGRVEEFFEQAVNSIKTRPKRLVFDPDTLFWLTNSVASIPEGTIEKAQSKKGYFSLVWKAKGQKIYFGFEAGSNWSRWKSITNEAKRLYESEKGMKAVFFRTPELKPIPGRWKIAPDVTEARKKYLHIYLLDQGLMSELYAAHDLYASAVEGNIPVSADEVFQFIRQRLQSFWIRILEPAPEKWDGPPGKAEKSPIAGEEPKKSLITKIRDIVKRDKFLSVADLMAKISPPVSEEELHRARACIAEIQVHTSPNMTVLQWRPNK